MHAHTTLALSLSATLAYALPASNCTSTVEATTTTVPAYVLPQETEVIHAPKDKHIVDLKDQISSLKEQLSSQLEASSTLCHAPAETTAMFGGHKGKGKNPSATHSAVNWSYIKEAHKSRLPATTAIAYPSEDDCTSTVDAPPKQTGGYESHPSQPAGYDDKPDSSAVESSSAEATETTEGPFPSFTSYANGTASHSATLSSQSSNTLTTGVTTSTSETASSLSSVISSSSSTTSLSPTYIPKLDDYSVAEIESGAALEIASEVANQRLQERELTGECTFETARVRTEFRKMSNEDRKSFTDAITCLKQVPTTVDTTAMPGVVSRYDEYVATHINMTMNIHVTADFLAWHRNYIWEWENDLINTCGYTGNLPYWDWARDAYAPHESELFNGDEFSMGSDGVFVPGREDTFLGLMGVTFPPGTGGGCTQSGPFSGDVFSTLGPLDSPYNDNVENDYDYNPRCLVRDLNVFFSSRYNTYAKLVSLATFNAEYPLLTYV